MSLSSLDSATFGVCSPSLRVVSSILTLSGILVAWKIFLLYSLTNTPVSGILNPPSTVSLAFSLGACVGIKTLSKISFNEHLG